MSTAVQHLNLIIHGRVQGVGFRYCAADAAREAGVCGFVRNEPDGSVYVEAEGTPEQLAEFLAWCTKGPPLARVDNVAQSEAPCVGFKGFEIRRR